VPCDLSQLFRTIVADLTPAIEERRQRVTVDVDPKCRLEADAGKLHDAIHNLVENAVNYSPDAAAIRLEATCESGTCRISVIDSGPGIPPQDLTRVFERFYRVDRSRSRPGTGLGLAIVKHLVELHGGDVRAANVPEGGAKFTVTLPERPIAAVTRN
jgi:signal transduction histidine kinase